MIFNCLIQNSLSSKITFSSRITALSGGILVFGSNEIKWSIPTNKGRNCYPGFDVTRERRSTNHRKELPTKLGNMTLPFCSRENGNPTFDVTNEKLSTNHITGVDDKSRIKCVAPTIQMQQPFFKKWDTNSSVFCRADPCFANQFCPCFPPPANQIVRLHKTRMVDTSSFERLSTHSSIRVLSHKTRTKFLRTAQN